ncbi:oligopeptide transporter OPT family [Metarhizium acridum CQMa 102]|uniref:Oligopeptide transporter OPT family n=1 Tax=Metarhizium acridum (strain CQMa 102) TaxID=655827 RepID=E9EIF7_METAQ|nr:oligopeptide transporter OPT family [Metarhizium acridum CQMa 102]EFY84304.1 oligopeptide transporter OPT family [Metarhizium acridum CQMa 102]
MAVADASSEKGSSPAEAIAQSSISELRSVSEEDDTAEFSDPRLRTYPVLLVAKTVDLRNNPNEPILTFRFWVLSTFWVIVGDAVSTIYYFKPYSSTLSSYIVQLLSWAMGDFMARTLPSKKVVVCNKSFSLNPGPWNAKEHALIIVAYWGSSRTAFGLGPLSALELYFDRKVSPGYGILFLLTSQLMGYGCAGLFRDILVRPPKFYYPGVLPNVALFNAMHSTSLVTHNKYLKFFAYVSCITFCWQWIPGVICPMLSSLALLCYMAQNSWTGFNLGSGYSGFGVLNVSLDWNYAGFFRPLVTPLWSNVSQMAGALIVCWALYPIMFFANVLGSQRFPAMSSGTFDKSGADYNISRVLSGGQTLNKTVMEAYSDLYWSGSYVMYFFWGFACSTAAIAFAILWHGKDALRAAINTFTGVRSDYEDDPYLRLMSSAARVPHWWYVCLLIVCTCLSLVCLYGADLGLPWWGFFVISAMSTIFTFPNGVLFGIANMQVDLSFLSEIVAGALFRGNPSAVLASLTLGLYVVSQVFRFFLAAPHVNRGVKYMKIPEKEMFCAQIYGTLVGPFVNYAVMRLVIDRIGKAVLIGARHSNSWLALKSKNYYSISVLWGVLGPQAILSPHSQYRWIYWSFLLGPAVVVIVYAAHRLRPKWQLETRCNPVVIMQGATWFPVFQTANLFTSFVLSLVFMGYMLRYRPVWFRKYNYLLACGLDTGAQMTQTVIMFTLNLANAVFPRWWGNNVRV